MVVFVFVHFLLAARWLNTIHLCVRSQFNTNAFPFRWCSCTKYIARLQVVHYSQHVRANILINCVHDRRFWWLDGRNAHCIRIYYYIYNIPKIACVTVIHTSHDRTRACIRQMMHYSCGESQNQRTCGDVYTAANNSPPKPTKRITTEDPTTVHATSAAATASASGGEKNYARVRCRRHRFPLDDCKFVHRVENGISARMCTFSSYCVCIHACHNVTVKCTAFTSTSTPTTPPSSSSSSGRRAPPDGVPLAFNPDHPRDVKYSFVYGVLVLFARIRDDWIIDAYIQIHKYHRRIEQNKLLITPIDFVRSIVVDVADGDQPVIDVI